MRMTAAPRAKALCGWYIGAVTMVTALVLAAGAVWLSRFLWAAVAATIVFGGWVYRFYLPAWLAAFSVTVGQHTICRHSGVFREHRQWVQNGSIQAVVVQQTLLSGHYHCGVVIIQYTGGRLWLPLLSGEDCRRLRRQSEQC